MPAPSSPAPLPATMRAWVLDGSAAGAMEKAMRLVADHPVPDAFARVARGDATAPGGKDALVVRVLYAALNPIDYKIPEMPVVGRFAPRRPATPGYDFCGRVVGGTAPGFAPGQLVAGKADDITQHGALADYVLAHAASVAAVPPGVAPAQAATAAIGGTTAWGAMAPAVRAVQAADPARAHPVHVFVNGGTGGVGTFAVQLAKALGCSVTATCSGANADLCRRLGADRVIDYRTEEPGAALATLVSSSSSSSPSSPPPVDVALDLVGHSAALYRAGDAYLAPGAPFILVGVHPGTTADIWLRPGWLGGGHHRAPLYMNTTSPAALAAVLGYMADGRVTVPIEKEVALADVPAAYALLKTERVRGKIVVKVADEEERP